MKFLKHFAAAVLLASFAFPAFANENIPADYFGDSPVAGKPGSGYDNPYALVSRSSAEQDDIDPTANYTPSPEDWRDRNIYQLFTDRFATDGNLNLGDQYQKNWFYGNKCTMGKDYSRNFHQGGNWRGLKAQIPYLQGMGVTAVWISGVQMNSQAARYDGSQKIPKNY